MRFLLIVIITLVFPLFAHAELSENTFEVQKTNGSSTKTNLNDEANLKSLIQSEPSLNTWLQLNLSTLYISQSKYHEALNILSQLQNDPLWDFWKNTLLSMSYLGLLAPHKTAQILEILPPEPDVEVNPNQYFYRQLYWQALETKRRSLEQMGRDQKEIASKMWGLFPDLKEESQGFWPQILYEPSSLSLADISGISLDKKTNRLHVLHTRGWWDLIPPLIHPSEIAHSQISFNDKCRALNELGNSLRNLQKMPEAIESFTEIVLLKCPENILVRALYWKAKLEWKSVKISEAISTYQAFINKFPDHRLTDDAFDALWKIYLEKKEDKKAKTALKNLIDYGKGDMRAQVLWNNAYDDFKKGKFSKTIEALDKILAAGPTENESYPQALYWKARSFEKMRDIKAQKKSAKGGSPKVSENVSADSKILYQRILDETPFSFYALFAGYRLHVHPTTLPFSTGLNPPSFMTPLDPFSQEVIITLDWLNKNSFHAEALNLLDYYSRTAPNIKQDEPWLAKKWQESGDFNQVLSLSFKHFDVGPLEGVMKKVDPLAFGLYPVPYPDEVEKGAKNSGIAPALIQGVMREESLFKPRVQSSAGAIGVMQLMPETARQQASFENLADFSVSELVNPQTNIFLGSSFLKKMIGYYHQNIPLAIMAYNAGPGNVNKWKKSFGDKPLDEFIEEIPFSETRGYVKRVMRSVQIYGTLLQDKKLPQPFFSMNF